MYIYVYVYICIHIYIYRVNLRIVCSTYAMPKTRYA